MIPIGLPSIWDLLLLLLIPLVAVLGTVILGLWLLLRLLLRLPLRLRSRSVQRLLLLIFAADLWLGYLVLDWFYLEPLGYSRVEARRQFTLAQAWQHGELLLPKGTQVYRVDNSDDGARDYPQTLTDSFVAVFPEPVQVANIWTDALDLTISIYPKARLAQAYPEGGEACAVGQVAVFDDMANYRDYPRDLFGRMQPMPEGKEAWFAPSKWQFLECEAAKTSDFHLGSRANLN